MSVAINHIIGKFSEPTILVLGDLILDVYLEGSTTRLSPEAPVPVIDIENEQSFIGGAANVAANIRALGARVIFCSVSGSDSGAGEAVRRLTQKGINADNIVQDPGRHTIVKERIIVHSQVIARFDKGSEHNIGAESEAALIRRLKEVYAGCDAVVIGDYNKGVLTPNVIKALRALRKKRPVFLAVDSKRLKAFRCLEPSVVKPNYEEAVRLLDLPYTDKDRISQISRYAKNICGITGSERAVVTMDADGAVAFEKHRLLCHCAAGQVPDPHVVGAGDTFISALTLSLVCSAGLQNAVKLASAAASVSVSKEHTACCTDIELRMFFAHRHKKVDNLAELGEICDLYRSQGKKIVFTNGCFDILHSGHVSFLNRAAKLGDVMIVGVNNDESIRRLKGNNRPINPLKDRIEVLGGLGVVDHITAFGKEEDDTPVEVIKSVRPHIFVKGGDYTKDRLSEADCVEALGGEVRFLPLMPDHSTTNVIRRIRTGIAPMQAVRSS